MLMLKNVEPYKVGDNEIWVTFQDENNWTLKDNNTWPDCDANRPEILTTYAERKEGIWYGKMAYGNGSINFNCPEEPAGMHYTYFQFVGDSKVTMAAGYSDVPLGFTDFTQIEMYGFQDETDQAANPVCLNEDDTVTPQTACTSSHADISTPNFGIDDKWVAPDDIVKILVEFPDGIDGQVSE